jgi:hypothetical protein
VHRLLRSPWDHPNLAHLLPAARAERLRRLTRRSFIRRGLVALALTAVLVVACSATMVWTGVFGSDFWTLACLGLATLAILVTDEVFERITFNRALDRSPRMPCPRCGYDLDSHALDSAAPTCPECGTRVTEMLP